MNLFGINSSQALRISALALAVKHHDRSVDGPTQVTATAEVFLKFIKNREVR